MQDSSQALQALGAIILYSLIALNFNKSKLNNIVIDIEAEKDKSAIALASTVIEEARSKSYDELAQGIDPVSSPSEFTHPSNFGNDGSESSRADFDDFDDYHGYSWDEETDNGDYEGWIEVCYIADLESKDTCINTQSRFKKMTVNIRYGNIDPVRYSIDRAPVQLEYINSYYH
jgi:hypothetical protein